MSLWPSLVISEFHTGVTRIWFFIWGDLEQVLSHGSETEYKSSQPPHNPDSYSQSSLWLHLWQYSTNVHMLLKQSGLFLELISLPQSQPVEILHGHAKHLDKLLWGQVTLRTQGYRAETQLSHYTCHCFWQVIKPKRHIWIQIVPTRWVS